MSPEIRAEALRCISELARIEQRLLDLGVADNRQNFTGAIGEWLAHAALGGIRLPVNTKGADLLMPDGVKTEVKTVKGKTGSTSFMRDFDEAGNLTYERLLLLVLSPDTNEVEEALLLDNKTLNECKSYNSRTKAYVVGVKKALTFSKTHSVKEKFQWH